MTRTIRVLDLYGEPRDVQIASLHNFAVHSSDPRDMLGRLLAALADAGTLTDDQLCRVAGVVRAVAASEGSETVQSEHAPASAADLASTWCGRGTLETAREIEDAIEPFSLRVEAIIEQRCKAAYAAGYAQAQSDIGQTLERRILDITLSHARTAWDDQSLHTEQDRDGTWRIVGHHEYRGLYGYASEFAALTGAVGAAEGER